MTDTTACLMIPAHDNQAQFKIALIFLVQTNLSMNFLIKLQVKLDNL